MRRGASSLAGQAVGMVSNHIIPGTSARAGRVGSAVVDRLFRLAGSGDYQLNDDVAVNSLFPGSASKGQSAAATFASGKHGDVRLRHREYIDEVYAPAAGAFGITQYPINPGLASTFQYLAQLADNFEEYVFHGLVFEFVSTTSPYNSSSAMGSVVLSMEYNAFLAPFTSKPQMENSDYAISIRPDRCAMYGVECENNAAQAYYVRTGGSTQPVNLTDIGNFFVAVQNANLPAGQSVGELWVTYDIELRRPHISPARYGYFHESSNLTATTVLAPFQASRVIQKTVNYGSLYGMTVSNSGNTSVISWPNADIGDTYMIFISVASGSTTMSTPANSNFSFGTTVGCTNTPCLYNLSAPPAANSGSWLNYPQSTSAGGTYQAISALAYVTITSLSAIPSVSITCPVASTAVATGTDVIIVDVGNGFISTTI